MEQGIRTQSFNAYIQTRLSIVNNNHCLRTRTNSPSWLGGQVSSCSPSLVRETKRSNNRRQECVSSSRPRKNKNKNENELSWDSKKNSSKLPMSPVLLWKPPGTNRCSCHTYKHNCPKFYNYHDKFLTKKKSIMISDKHKFSFWKHEHMVGRDVGSLHLKIEAQVFPRKLET